MSRLDDLIRELCPDGVPTQPLGSLGRRNSGTSITASAMKLMAVAEGPIRVFAGGQTVADVAEHAVPARDVIREPSIVVKSRGNIGFVFCDRPFTHKSELWSYTLAAPHIDQKFVYYFLLTKVATLQALARATSVKLPQLGVADTDRLRVPVPPLEVQREIVRVLDSFAELEAVLEAELDARRVQHSHYWEALLEPKAYWRRTTVGEISRVFDGPHATPKKTDSGPWYLSISSLNRGTCDLSRSAHLSEAQFPEWTRRVRPRPGDTLFSYETRIGEAAFWESDDPASLGRRMGLLRPFPELVRPRFLTLAYLGPEFQRLLVSKTVQGATVSRIPIADMGAWPISMPPLGEQDRIVAQLGALDTLVNDLSIGLPAELSARRKQYEYYRDELMSFKEAS